MSIDSKEVDRYRYLVLVRLQPIIVQIVASGWRWG